MNKELKIFDKGDVKDKCIKGTKIVLAETGTGKVLFTGSNKVIVSGSEFNAIKDFDFSTKFGDSDSQKFLSTIPSYDTALANNSHPLVPTDESTVGMFPYSPDGSIISDVFESSTALTGNKKTIYDYFTRRVCLFCVGNDGCGEEASRVFKVHNTKWIAPWGYADYDSGDGETDPEKTGIDNCLIPFKYRPTGSDLSEAYRNKYFGRSVADGTISYYFKGFESVEFIRRYADDSAFLVNSEDVWKDTRGSEAEAVVKLKMEITNSDCREWFNRSTGVNDAKINTISLCTAVPYMSGTDTNSQLYYADIRPFTRFNFPNESLVGYTKGIDITYYLYY